MAYEFTKLGEVEALEKVPKGANALIEIAGDIKRVPGDSLNGGIKTAIIKSSDYDDVLAGGTSVGGDAVTYSCVNMTFEEALAEVKAGKPLNVMVLQGGWSSTYGDACELYGVYCVVYSHKFPHTIIIDEFLYWTSDGISTEEPSAASILSAKLSRAKNTTEG